MSADLPPQGWKLIWCLRKYAWVVVACLLVFTVAPLVFPAAASSYQADALVFARQLTVNQRVLPQLGEAVFSDGAVAAAVAADPAIGGDTSGLIPERLSVVAAEDSIVLVVQARDPDPATAARLADLGAAALVAELNRGGAGVGEFVLQSEAIVSTEPLSGLTPMTRTAIGALAGLLTGIGLVALIAAVRRPVVTAEDVEGVVGVPLLGTVQLPLVARGDYPGPLGVRGIATVTRWLATVPPGRLLVISPPSAVEIRHRVFVMAAVALSTHRTLRFEAPAGLIDAIGQHRLEHRDATGEVRLRPEVAEELVLVDGGSALEIVDPATTSVSVVAVVPLGVRRRHLRALASDYLDSGLVGVVLIGGRPGLQRVAARRGRGAPTPSYTLAGGVQQISDVPVQGRA